MTDARRYTEAELHAIFERAAKRQEEAHRAEAASRGQLTLAELQEIGAASGIDPAHIAAAAHELNAGPPRDVHTFLGAPTEVERSRIVADAVSDAEWAQMVAEVRRAFGIDGSVGQLGQIREWTATKGTGTNSGATAMRLSLEPVDGGTRVILKKSVRETTKGFGIAAAIQGAMALVFFTLGVLTEPELLIASGMMALMALAFAGITRGWLAYWGGKQEAEFEATLDRLELIARAEPDPAPPVRSTETAAERRIDLDALPEEPDDVRPDERSRMRS